MEITTAIDKKTYKLAATDLPYKTWIDGPIATTRIYRDWKSPDQFSPEFIVTRWHTLNKTQVRFIGNNDNAQKVAELWLSVKLTAEGQTLYQKPFFPMSRASRWTKAFWIGAAPPLVNVQPNLLELIRTHAVPNYDTSIKINASAISNAYTNWQKAKKDLTDPGNLTKAMGTGGGRPEIGPYPTYTVLWLYTGDKRMREVALGSADLAAAWHTHYREPAAGKYYSIEDNPSAQLLNLVGVKTAGDTDSWGWVADLSHQPSMFYVPYLLTGDPFYLEEMLYWASWSAAYSQGAGVKNSCGRGPIGKEGGIPGIRCISMRGQAWAFRNRAETAWITPDFFPEKAYFDRLTRDAIKIWEGERAIGDLKDPLREWGRRVTPVAENNPLHWWELGNGAFVQEPLDVKKSSAAISTWEQNFIRYALYRALDLGYPTGPLIAWNKVNLDGVMKVDHRLTAAYRSGTLKPDGTPHQFTDLPNLYEAGFDLQKNWAAQTINSEHGYAFIAIPAGDLTALSISANRDNPKWAILPR
jgi:hypothetical protein